MMQTPWDSMSSSYRSVTIRPSNSRSHRATTPPRQGPEGHGFNPANNTRTKAPHLAAAGLVFHPPHPNTVISTGVRGPRRTFFVRWGATRAFCAVAERPAARLYQHYRPRGQPAGLSPEKTPALAFLSVIRPERSRMGGNLLLFSHHATTPPWQGPEGHGFNPANNTQTKAPHLAREASI